MSPEERRLRADRRSTSEGFKWNATKEVGSFVTAEMLSVGVSLGVFTFIDEVAPRSVEKISRAISKICVEPYLDTIEKSLNTVCRSKDCQVDPNQSREERAYKYAHYLTRWATSFAVGIASEPFIRNGLNRWWGVKNPASNLKVIGFDKAVHLGGLVLINTVAAKQTDSVIDTLSHVLQKTLGWSPDRSKKAADGTIRWEVANVASAIITSIGMVMRQMAGRDKISH